MLIEIINGGALSETSETEIYAKPPSGESYGGILHEENRKITENRQA